VIDQGEEATSSVPVGCAMVRGERRGHDWAHAEHPVLGPGALADATESDQRHLRRIDHAVHELDATVAEVRVGDRWV
jgi:hypothetical protein